MADPLRFHPLVADDLAAATRRAGLRMGWYHLRSETVHDGTLHGHELGVGPLFDFGASFEDQPEGEFALGIVPVARLITARLVELAADHLLLCYRADWRAPRSSGSDQPGAARAMYITSIWSRRADGWINTFSQDTPTEARSDLFDG